MKSMKSLKFKKAMKVLLRCSHGWKSSGYICSYCHTSKAYRVSLDDDACCFDDNYELVKGKNIKRLKVADSISFIIQQELKGLKGWIEGLSRVYTNFGNAQRAQERRASEILAMEGRFYLMIKSLEERLEKLESKDEK